MKLTRLLTLAAVLGLAAAALPLRADEFMLKDKETGKSYGPFKFNDGTVNIHGKEYEVIKTDRTDETRLKLKDIHMDLVYHKALTKDILKDIEKKANELDPQKRTFKLAYTPSDMDKTSIVNMEMKNVTLEDAMNRICEISGMTWRVRVDGTVEVTYK